MKLEIIEEPQLEFGFSQKTEYTRDGLYLFGPIQDGIAPVEPICGAVGTAKGIALLNKWIEGVSGFIAPKDDQPHHVPYPGFRQIFGTAQNPSIAPQLTTIDDKEIDQLLRLTNRHEAVKAVVDLYVSQIVQFERRSESTPKFWFIVVPEKIYQYARALSPRPPGEAVPGTIMLSKSAAKKLGTEPSMFDQDNKDAEIFLYARDFRRQIKARLLDHKVVTQLVRETTLDPMSVTKSDGRPIRGVEDPATIAWKLTSAMYYKAGGRPWQLADVRPGVCYVGLVYKVLPEDPKGFACCAAQMFLSNGEGVVFRGALGPWYQTETKQFHLSAAAAEDLLRTVVAEYKNQFGHVPTELFIHATSRFSNDEWSGFQKACPPETAMGGIQIRDFGSGFKLYRQGKYPVVRGTCFKLSERSAYLWTTGYIPRLDTYMGPETPNPIQITIQRGEFALDTVLKDIMGLTKINFNSCLFSDRLPVTIKFANAIGDVLVAAPRTTEPKLPFKFYI